MAAKISTGVLMLAFLAAAQPSYAVWGVGVSVGGRYHHEDHGFYRWHEHPRWGLHIHYLPAGYLTIWVGGTRYYYYDGLYYTYVGYGDYVLVTPPLGAYVRVIPSDFQPVIINGRTYYTDNGIYYILTRRHGYKVVAAPLVYAQPQAVVNNQDSFSVNIPNNSGGYSSVVIRRSGNGFVGPQGEFYGQFPSVAQLKVMYGK